MDEIMAIPAQPYQVFDDIVFSVLIFVAND